MSSSGPTFIDARVVDEDIEAPVSGNDVGDDASGFAADADDRPRRDRRIDLTRPQVLPGPFKLGTVASHQDDARAKIARARLR